MLISCQFMAEGAVRRPLCRLIPKAAQSRFESVCCESVSEPNWRVDLRSLRTSIRGRPPVVYGGGSWTGLSACAAEIAERQIVVSRSLNRNGFQHEREGCAGLKYCQGRTDGNRPSRYTKERRSIFVFPHDELHPGEINRVAAKLPQ